MSSYDDVADPELLARLTAWFGSGEPITTATPSFTSPPEKNPKLAKIEKVLDRALVARLEGLASDPTRFTQQIEVSSKYLDNPLPLFTPPPEPPEAEELEYWQPDDIEHALAQENTPQSVLRDLFRPVTHFHLMLRTPDELDEVPVDAVAEVRKALEEPLRAKHIELSGEMIATDIGELREILARPWEDSKPEKTAEVVGLAEADSFWFGLQGGYDPDL